MYLQIYYIWFWNIKGEHHSQYVVTITIWVRWWWRLQQFKELTTGCTGDSANNEENICYKKNNNHDHNISSNNPNTLDTSWYKNKYEHKTPESFKLHGARPVPYPPWSFGILAAYKVKNVHGI